MGYAHHADYIAHIKSSKGSTYGDRMAGIRSNPQTFPDHNNPQQMRPDTHTHTHAHVPHGDSGFDGNHHGHDHYLLHNDLLDASVMYF